MLGDESLEKTRQQTAASKEEQANGGEEAASEKPRMPRDNTMVATAQVSVRIDISGLSNEGLIQLSPMGSTVYSFIASELQETNRQAFVDEFIFNCADCAAEAVDL